jgi:hypothetical protein
VPDGAVGRVERSGTGTSLGDVSTNTGVVDVDLEVTDGLGKETGTKEEAEGEARGRSDQNRRKRGETEAYRTLVEMTRKMERLMREPEA